jgi:hypothetical protein
VTTVDELRERKRELQRGRWQAVLFTTLVLLFAVYTSWFPWTVNIVLLVASVSVLALSIIGAPCRLQPSTTDLLPTPPRRPKTDRDPRSRTESEPSAATPDPRQLELFHAPPGAGEYAAPAAHSATPRRLDGQRLIQGPTCATRAVVAKG